jgi:hypothetical protein
MQAIVKVTTTNIMRDMAIRNEHKVRRSRNCALRSLIVIVGFIAVCWGLVEFPIFWRESSIERIAGQVIAGDPLKVAVLERQLPIVKAIEMLANCHPVPLRSAAIIRHRLEEITGSGTDRGHVVGRLKPLEDMILRSLSCSPADPFLWLVLW